MTESDLNIAMVVPQGDTRHPQESKNREGGEGKLI